MLSDLQFKRFTVITVIGELTKNNHLCKILRLYTEFLIFLLVEKMRLFFS